MATVPEPAGDLGQLGGVGAAEAVEVVTDQSLELSFRFVVLSIGGWMEPFGLRSRAVDGGEELGQGTQDGELHGPGAQQHALLGGLAAEAHRRSSVAHSPW